MQRSYPCAYIRGGTSKGLYFLAEDLPSRDELRDKVFLAAMGSPDERQIDGVGGAHPLTSKVAIVSSSTRSDADVDYLFLQVHVDKAEVSDGQNCGNILAGVGPFAIERGLVQPTGDLTDVRIHMVNTGSLCVARVQTPGGQVEYEGSFHIDGVPGIHAPILLNFLDVAGSSCGALLPTGNVWDDVNGVEVTCIDNGMPVILVAACSRGLSGYETPEELEAADELRARIEAIRLVMGPRMNLGDVRTKTVPKISIIAPPEKGGTVSTRTFIPHRVHEAIGVLGAVSVATALAIPGSVAEDVLDSALPLGSHQIDVEHPGGFFSVELEIERNERGIEVVRSALIRTARLLMDGRVYVPNHLTEA